MTTVHDSALPHPHGTSPSAPRALVALLLILILALAASLRLVGLDWDEGHLLHPDERHLAWTTSDMRSVDSLAAYFDTRTSTLNPNNVGHEFYVYGNFPTILARYIGEAVEKTSLYDVYMVGRYISVTFDLLTVLLLFLAARRLFDWRAGLLAALLYAGAAFPIQQAHFFTVDAIANTFVAACFWFAARVMLRHNWFDYMLFGLLLGLGMASKIAIAPLALILIIALILRAARHSSLLAAGWFAPWGHAAPERPLRWPSSPRRAVVIAAAGLALAGLITVLVFRVAQPYAFLPPNSGEPIDREALGGGLALISRLADPLGFRPNADWLADIQEVRRWVTGKVDAPPNHQWAQRTPLVFPWVNMVRIGLGWPLGLFAWLSLLWALWEIARGHRGAVRLVLPVTWVLLYFIWQGSGWVMTMRYFLPIYPFLLMLAAWAVFTLWDRVRALLASRGAGLRHPAALITAGLGVFVLLSGLAWGFAVSRIYTRPHTRVAASTWIVEHVPSDITLTIQTADGLREFQIGLPNDWPVSGPTAPEDPTAPLLHGTLLDAGVTRRVEFAVPFSGTLTSIRFHRLAPTGAGSTPAALDVALLPTGGMVTPLVQSRIEGIGAAGSDPRGQPYTLSIVPLELVANRTYALALTPDEQHTLVLCGASIAVEGTWDDPVPISIAPYSVWGAQYSPLAFEMAYEDVPEKRARMQVVLDHADYITISSNRFYDSLRRNPQRWPMSLAYYEALFSGDLGFELVGDFTSRPNLGPIEFHDDSAEEAWTVYDHPRVFVFRKTSAYDPARTAAILNSVDLDTAVRAIAGDAEGRPVRLPLPDGGSLSGGSAAGLGGDAPSYDPTPRDFFSRNQPLAVIIWWALIALIGWAAFPLLWALLPGLPDRAYPLARTFGLLFVAWLAWLLASLRVLPWRSFTVLLALIALAALSAAVIWPRRREFAAWLRTQRTTILLIELLAALLFVAFVLIRAANPDLWHPTFGGEKPMDLAYLNAVLRSDFFPPYDPWFQGGTINYYYFGFVIVGVPIKLLDMRVPLAYNLMLPTLYALTGIGAFSAASNLLAPRANRADSSPLSVVRRGGQGVRLGQGVRFPPLIAGFGALILAVVLGSLDQIRTILWGLAELGSGAPAWAVTAFPPLDDTLRGLTITLNQDVHLPIGLGEWYWNATRVIPVPIDPATQYPTEIGPITEFPFFTFLYADLHAHMIALPVTLFVIGWCIALVRGPGVDAPAASRLRNAVGALLVGFVGALAVGSLRPTNTWDWPTYLALSAAALMIGHFRRRGSKAALPALGIGGLGAVLLGGLVFWAAISSSQSVSGTLALALTGLAALIGLIAGFALALGIMRAPAAEEPHDALRHWLTLLGGGMQVIALAAATALLFLPFIQSYQLGYDRVIPWTGSRTPLWAYFDILGIFLFVIATWLLWESRAFLRAINRLNVIPALAVLVLVIIFTQAAALSITPVAALALPMLMLALLHFLRREQPAAKRFALIMLIGALALTLAVEVIVLQGDLSRMNTVFKFYMQVWVLLAVVAGAALGWLLPALRRIPEALSLLWMAALALLVFLALLYTLLAVQAKIEDRWNPDAPQTLDGMDYMKYVANYENNVVFSLAPDYAMLRWLQDNIEGTPVVVEGLSWREYLWGSRVSVYTGLPAIVGWNWHQRQQRPVFANEVWNRHNDVYLIYSVANIDWAMALLERYHADLIVVGELERAYYPAAGLDKFRRMAEQGLLRVIYERDNTVIYEIVRE